MSEFNLNASGAIAFVLRVNSTDLDKGLQEAKKEFSEFTDAVKESLNRAARASGSEVPKIVSDLERVGDESEHTALTAQTLSSALKNMISFDVIKQTASAAFDALLSVGSEYAELSQKTNVSVETLSKWSLAAQKGSTTSEALAETVAKMSNSLTLEGEKGEQAREALLKLHLSEKEVVSNPEQGFEKVVSALQNVSSSSERASLAYSLFGESAHDLADLLDQGRGSFEGFNKEAEKSGQVISSETAESSLQAHEAIEQLKASLSSATASLGSLLTPALAEAAASFSRGLGSIVQFTSAHKDASKITAGLATAIGALVLVHKIEKSELYQVVAAKIAYAAANAKSLLSVKALTSAVASSVASFGALKLALFGIGGALAVAGYAFKRYYEEQTKAAELTHEMKEAADAADRLRNVDLDKFTFLEGVANQGNLANETFEKAVGYIESLREKYGDLGVTVDETGKRIVMAADAQVKFNEAAKANAQAAIDKEISEEEENYKKLQDEQQRKIDAYSSTAGFVYTIPRNVGHALFGDFVQGVDEKWSSEIDEVGKKILETQQKLNDLRKRRKAIDEGDQEAIFTPNQDEDQEQERAEKILELDKQIADAEEKARRAKQSRVENAIEDLKREEQAYTSALKMRLAYEERKPEQERNVELIETLRSKIDGTDSRVDEQVAKLKAEEYESLEKQIADAEQNMTGETTSETEKRIAKIDEETAAYRKLLESAAAVAQTEEQRSAIQGKLASLDDSANKRKEEVYEESKKSAPSDVLINLQKTLAITFQEAMTDGIVTAKEQEQIADAAAKVSAQQQSESQVKALDEYQRAVEALRTAGESLEKARTAGNDAEIAIASEKYADASEETSRAYQALVTVAYDETAATQDVSEAVNDSLDESSKELAGCITLSGADAMNQAQTNMLGMNEGFASMVSEASRNGDLLTDVRANGLNSIGLQTDIKNNLAMIFNKMGTKFA